MKDYDQVAVVAVTFFFLILPAEIGWLVGRVNFVSFCILTLLFATTGLCLSMLAVAWENMEKEKRGWKRKSF